MAFGSSAPAQATAADTNAGTHVDAPELRLFVMGLFFIFGGITSLNDVLITRDSNSIMKLGP